jgi:hypothetical protein
MICVKAAKALWYLKCMYCKLFNGVKYLGGSKFFKKYQNIVTVPFHFFIPSHSPI